MDKEKRILLAQRMVSFLMRMGIAVMLPLWGLVMLVLGAVYRDPWWLGCGAAVAGAGGLLAIGSPLIEPLLREL